jgi:esterase/lipase
MTFRRREFMEYLRVNEEFSDIVIEDIRYGKVYGALFYKKGVSYRRSVLLIHGTAGNRYGLKLLAKRLVECGYFCLSIDLPSHYDNPNEYVVGNVCESIYESIYYLKKKCGMKTVSVLGHSIGAVGAFFSLGGYTNKIEKELYLLGENIIKNLKSINILIKKNKVRYKDKIKDLFSKVDRDYSEMKNIIFDSLKHIVSNDLTANCYVLLAPPLDLKSGVPGLKIFRNLPKKIVKLVFENVFHKPALKQAYKENNPLKYYNNKDNDVTWQMFNIKDLSSLLDYMINLKEFPDFMKFIEDLIFVIKTKQGTGVNGDKKISFIEYIYMKYIKNKPKLFIYGKRDLYL